MKKCICCKHQSKNIMGPLCGALKCKCKGVKCPHCGIRVKLLEVGAGHIVFCLGCGCGFTGHPDNSELQASFTCKYAEKDILVLV